jgi:hypothetical protein
MRERLGSVAAEAAAGAGNQDGLGHDDILSLDAKAVKVRTPFVFGASRHYVLT